MKLEIKLLKDKAYFEDISLKYGDLRVIEASSFDEIILKVDKDHLKITTADIKYPQKAREYGTQGYVKIAYVMLENYDIQDI